MVRKQIGASFKKLGMTINGIRNLLMGGLFLMVVLQVHVWGSPKEGQLLRRCKGQLALTMNWGQ